MEKLANQPPVYVSRMTADADCNWDFGHFIEPACHLLRNKQSAVFVCSQTFFPEFRVARLVI